MKTCALTRCLAALSIGVSLLSSAALAAPQKLQLALNWKAEPEFGGFYEAKLKGLFEKKGLDVQVTEGGAGAPVVQMVASGKVPFGISSADEVIVSQERGTDVIALFAVYKTNPQGVMAHPERGFKSIGDVFNAPGTLAMQLGAPFTLYLKNKYPKAKARLVPYQGGVGQFLADKSFSQQCFVTSEPLAARKKGQEAQAFVIADEGFNPYTTVVIARRSVVDKDPATAKALVEAVREGWAAYLKAPEGANEHMAKLNPSMDAETFRQVAEIQKPFIQPKGESEKDLGKMTDARWAEIVEQLKGIKLIKKDHLPAELYRNL